MVKTIGIFAQIIYMVSTKWPPFMEQCGENCKFLWPCTAVSMVSVWPHYAAPQFPWFLATLRSIAVSMVSGHTTQHHSFHGFWPHYAASQFPWFLATLRSTAVSMVSGHTTQHRSFHGFWPHHAAPQFPWFLATLCSIAVSMVSGHTMQHRSFHGFWPHYAAYDSLHCTCVLFPVHLVTPPRAATYHISR